VFAIALFGILGYGLMKLGAEPAPLLLGFILGPLLENHAVLLVMAVGALILAILPAIRQKREVVFAGEDEA
jgi:TctA family transporter